MPIPSARKDETEQEFVSRCMGDDMMVKEYKDQKQRAAICYRQFDERKKKKGTANWDDVRNGNVLGLI